MKSQPLSQTTSRYLPLITLSLWISILLHVIYHYSDLPSLIPTHYTLAGIPDDLGPKLTLVYLCLVGLLVTVMLAAIPRYPQFYNLPYSIDPTKRTQVLLVLRQMTETLNAWVAVLFLLLIGGTVQIGMQKWNRLPFAALPLLCVILVSVLAYYSYRLWQYRSMK